MDDPATTRSRDVPPPNWATIEQVAREVAAACAALPAVTAVSLGGSLAGRAADDRSDVDLYVYAEEPLSLAARADTAARFAAWREVGNDAWEPGDEWLDARTGIAVDVMHRRPSWIADRLDRVLARHEVSVGYSTALWHNVLHAPPLFDRDGWYGRLRATADRPYPLELKRAIVAKNHPLLRRPLSSFRTQIERAPRRADAVSVQHRLAALLASYFDVFFAANELPHPGEKRLMAFALACTKRPPDIAERIEALLAIPAAPPSPDVLGAIDALVDGLDAVLAAEGLVPPDAAGGIA